MAVPRPLRWRVRLEILARVPDAGGEGLGLRPLVMGSALGGSATPLSRDIPPCSSRPGGEPGLFDASVFPNLPPKEKKHE